MVIGVWASQLKRLGTNCGSTRSAAMPAPDPGVHDEQLAAGVMAMLVAPAGYWRWDRQDFAEDDPWPVPPDRPEAKDRKSRCSGRA